MADVNLNPFGGDADERSDRAQLILVGGLLVAIGLVALVLLLNSVIYAQNLATRSVGPGSAPAVEMQTDVEDGIAGVVERENARPYGDYSVLETNVTDSIGVLDRALRRQSADRGVIVDVHESSASYDRGQLIRQTNASRAFTNESGEPDWALATDVERTRAASLVVNRSGLTATDDAEAGYFVSVTNGSASWNAYVHESSSSDEIVVEVKNGSETFPTEACRVSASTAEIDLTAGTVAGEPCPGLAWATGVSGPYDVVYRNGDDAAGTYDLTIDGIDANEASLATSDTDAAPYVAPAVYAVTVDVYYGDARLTYEFRLRVAPGEPA